MNSAILFIWTVFVSEDRGANKIQSSCTRLKEEPFCWKILRDPQTVLDTMVTMQLNYPAWHNLGKHAHRKVTGMLKANEDQPGTGANLPQLHGSCYQVKAEKAAEHTMSPFPVEQERQDRSTETLIGCLCAFSLSWTRFSSSFIQLSKHDMALCKIEYDLERQEISRLHELTV